MKDLSAPLQSQSAALDNFFQDMLADRSDTSTTEPITDASVAVEPEPATAVPDEDRLPYLDEQIELVPLQVGGLWFALPRKFVHSILDRGFDIDANGATPVILGEMEHDRRNYTLIDTARILLPAEHLQRLPGATDQRIRHLVLLADSQWALGCSAVDGPVLAARSALKLRPGGGKRPWLAGIWSERRWALLEPDGLCGLLPQRMA